MKELLFSALRSLVLTSLLTLRAQSSIANATINVITLDLWRPSDCRRQGASPHIGQKTRKLFKNHGGGRTVCSCLFLLGKLSIKNIKKYFFKINHKCHHAWSHLWRPSADFRLPPPGRHTQGQKPEFCLKTEILLTFLPLLFVLELGVLKLQFLLTLTCLINVY